MARIVKDEILNITNEYKKKYGDDYQSKAEYKFLIDLCNQVPTLTLSDEFPNSLLTDFFEVIFELTYEIIYNFEPNKDKVIDFLAFVEKYLSLPEYRYCVVSVFDAINCNSYRDNIEPLFNENLKKEYEVYVQNR